MLDTAGSQLAVDHHAHSVVSNTAEVSHMFHDIVQPSIRVGSRRAFALPLSIVTHLLVVVLLLIIPLMAPGVLPAPTVALMAFVTGDVVLPSPPSPAPRQPVAENSPAVGGQPEAVLFEAPGAIAPEKVIDSSPTPVGAIEFIGGLPGEIAENLGPLLPPTPPSEPVAVLRIGGKIRPPDKIKDVKPVYPTIAQTARVEGIVIIEATIGPAGTVLEAKLLRSIPLLDAAALEAVRQWEFTPTLLNGSPVAVVMTVTVKFTLR
jgi:periplasmic protein TonB